MPFPVRVVSLPTDLAGHLNGRLALSLLVETPGLAGGPPVRLLAPAARAWRALTAAAQAAGHTLKATSLYDSYRPYEVQVRIFKERYVPQFLPDRPYRWWNGGDPTVAAYRWWQKPDTAVAAVPGTSNHGLGLAVDVGEEIDGDAGTESIDEATLEWLRVNAERFGFSWEV